MTRAFITMLAILMTAAAYAQPKANPLRDKAWNGLGAGMHNGDYVSYNVLAWRAVRSDYIITAYRLGYSQELITGPADSCTISRSKSLEAGIMWGDGYGNDRYYVCAMAGMGINQRWYCDDDDPGEYVKKSRLTIGVPAQAEAGINITPDLKLGLGIVANWNFLEPYVGGMLHLTWWSDAKRD
jgi:hypothetical protein